MFPSLQGQGGDIISSTLCFFFAGLIYGAYLNVCVGSIRLFVSTNICCHGKTIWASWLVLCSFALSLQAQKGRR